MDGLTDAGGSVLPEADEGLDVGILGVIDGGSMFG